MVNNFQIGKIKNSELTKGIIEDIDGLSYHPNFISEEEYIQLLNILRTLDYKEINGRATKYFGLNYTHLKETHNSEKTIIPPFFNLLTPLGIESDQLVITYYPENIGHDFIRESDLFGDNIIIIILGSSFKYSFCKDDISVDFLVEPRSLLLISGKSREWRRRIKGRLKDKFNGLTILRSPFYTLTFRKIR